MIEVSVKQAPNFSVIFANSACGFRFMHEQFVDDDLIFVFVFFAEAVCISSAILGYPVRHTAQPVQSAFDAAL